MNCYNCNEPLTKETNHDEHIPQKNLFITYPPEYKKNLLKVPSCYNCNNGKSNDDSLIRDAIAIQNDGDALMKEMTNKFIRSVLRANNFEERFEFSKDGKTIYGIFNKSKLDFLHIRNFKGLFYHKYGFSIPDKYEIGIVSEGDENNHNLQYGSSFIRPYLNETPIWSTAGQGHEDIFKYKLKSLIPDGNLFVDSENVENSIGFACQMVYHNKLNPLIIALDLSQIPE